MLGIETLVILGGKSLAGKALAGKTIATLSAKGAALATKKAVLSKGVIATTTGKSSIAKGALNTTKSYTLKKGTKEALPVFLILAFTKAAIGYYIIVHHKKTVTCPKCQKQIKTKNMLNTFQKNGLRDNNGEYKFKEVSFHGKCPHCKELIQFTHSNLIKK